MESPLSDSSVLQRSRSPIFPIFPHVALQYESCTAAELFSQPNNSPELNGNATGLEFSVGSLSILSLADVPAKSAECPAVEASLHMLTLHHQCNGPILWMRGRKTEADLRLPSHDTLWTCVGSLGEALEMSIVVPPKGREMDPVAQKPGVY